MANGWRWEEKTLSNELIQGMELAKQLREQLNTTSSVETREFLVGRILSSYEKALLILNWSGSIAGQAAHTAGVTAGVSESPKSLNGSPQSDDFDGAVKDYQSQNDASKKRKTMPQWTDQVKVSSENGLEGPQEDGYNWRKYGQKDILGAKYPRSYYRCTYRNTQNCWATKQVQRSDENPAVFDVTYRGMHTCSHGHQSVLPPASPEKQEQKQNNNHHQQQHSQEALFNLQKRLRVNTEELGNENMAPPLSFPSTYGCLKSVGSYSPSFISPASPEPNCYSVSPYQMDSFGGIQNLQQSESGFTEIISAISGTNSPLVDFHFPLEPVEMDPNFPFDTSGFFPYFHADNNYKLETPAPLEKLRRGANISIAQQEMKT